MGDTTANFWMSMASVEAWPTLSFTFQAVVSWAVKRTMAARFTGTSAPFSQKKAMSAPNYRLAPEFNWPAGGEDVKTAIDWCRENIAHYGGEPDRIHVIGQSAGATHVATALFHRDLAIDGQLASATLINGVFDATDIPPAENLVAYFGPDDEGRRQRSPLAHVRKTSLPIMIGVTEYDPAFLAYPSYRLADALTKANGKSPTFLWLAGHNHVSCIFAIGSSSDDLGPELVNFLCNVTRTAGEPEGATA
jgi:dienelactone hydrolase